MHIVHWRWDLASLYLWWLHCPKSLNKRILCFWILLFATHDYNVDLVLSWQHPSRCIQKLQMYFPAAIPCKSDCCMHYEVMMDILFTTKFDGKHMQLCSSNMLAAVEMLSRQLLMLCPLLSSSETAGDQSSKFAKQHVLLGADLPNSGLLICQTLCRLHHGQACG